MFESHEKIPSLVDRVIALTFNHIASGAWPMGSRITEEQSGDNGRYQPYARARGGAADGEMGLIGRASALQTGDRDNRRSVIWRRSPSCASSWSALHSHWRCRAACEDLAALRLPAGL